MWNVHGGTGTGRIEEETREIDECGMEECDTLDSTKKTIVILGDRWWPQTGKQERDKNGKNFP